MTPTNIIFIQSDQHRYDCLGLTGHPLLETPNLDRMAREGMQFTSAFCPTPLCSPARASLLTGLWPTEHRLITNPGCETGHGFKRDLPTYSQALRDAGYYLGYVAKWHAHSELGPTDFGFGDYVPESEYFRWREEQGLPPWPLARLGGNWRDSPDLTRWFGGTDAGIAPNESKLGWGAGRIIDMLYRVAESGQPFYLRWDPVEPHLPNIVPEPYASMYPPQEIAPWGSYGDEFVGKPYIQAQQLRTWGIDGWSWPEWAPIVGRYLGEISLMDAQIGRILDTLDALGLTDETMVIYTTDHGDMCGSHGMIDKHFVMYEDVVRVPLIVRWPAGMREAGLEPGAAASAAAGAAAGAVCDAFVSNSIDLPPTFCELADVPVPDTFCGRSLLPLLQGASDNGREDIFATYHGNQFGLYSQRMVRDRRWKYVWNATAPDELYDLQTDPWELNNRATDPGCDDVLERLRRRTVDWMEATDDGLLNMWTGNQLLRGLTV